LAGESRRDIADSFQLSPSAYNNKKLSVVVKSIIKKKGKQYGNE